MRDTFFNLMMSVLINFLFSLFALQQVSLQISEVYKPIQDPLISKCSKIIGMDEDQAVKRSSLVAAAKQIWSKAFPKPRRSWMPTGCLVGEYLNSRAASAKQTNIHI